MKNSRGISVISVVVTIIVIIIISSITVFTGINILNSAREEKAQERLEVIYQALTKDELALGIRDTAQERVLQNDDYIKIGLEGYANDKQMPNVTFAKRIGGIEDPTDTTLRTYTLKTFLTVSSEDTVEIEREYSVLDSKYSTGVLFDSVAGVNRPQLTNDMTAVSFANSEVGEFVSDVYTERWYSYDDKAPNYANVEIELNGETRTYVWIPRYAYKIQDYYKENALPNVPESAIEIIFLKGITNTDKDDNMLPNGYTVHPAFSYGDKALAGIWVEKYSQETVGTVSEVFDEALDLYNTEVAHSHLLRNSEWSAMAYLAHSCGAAKSGSSTNNNSGIQDINSNGTEYIAAYIDDDSSSELDNNGSSLVDADNKDKNSYVTTGDSETLNSTNPTSIGDALVETSSGENANSAWFNSTTIQPRPSTPFIARGTGDSVFGFKVTSGDEESAYYRTALIIDESI